MGLMESIDIGANALKVHGKESMFMQKHRKS